MLTISLPVEPQIRGKVASGLEITGIEVVPETVSIMIPSTFNGGSLKVVTEPTDISLIAETTTLNPKLILPEGARLADETPPEAEVTVNVSSKEEVLEEE
jgi:YbbR domain-containing protein